MSSMSTTKILVLPCPRRAIGQELVRKAGDEASQSREASAGFGGFQQKIGTGSLTHLDTS